MGVAAVGLGSEVDDERIGVPGGDVGSAVVGLTSGVSVASLSFNSGSCSVCVASVSWSNDSAVCRIGVSALRSESMKVGVCESGVFVRMSCRPDEQCLKDEMSGDRSLFAAGKTFSRNCASPVTRIRLEFLSHNLQALAFGSMPTKMYLLAIGPTLECLLRSSA